MQPAVVVAPSRARAAVLLSRPVPRRRDPQLALSFARPRPRRGGLELEEYRELVERLRGDARRVAEHFRLPPFELDADRPDAHDRFGICFDDGRIRVRLVHARTGRPLRYSALIDTVVHELAHLRHLDHGPRWESLYHRMLDWCRQQGVYRPREVPRPVAGESLRAEQLELFRPTVSTTRASTVAMPCPVGLGVTGRARPRGPAG